ncbi:HSF-type DNA-binding-domain-containing protein, partial [Crassisporium funariophilum]
RMLEEPAFNSVVCWGPLGDCFIVKGIDEFTKTILPLTFNHSNFASFVRQLNKYDFHKVKNTEQNGQPAEHNWIFRHQDFHAGRRDALKNIKRKVVPPRQGNVFALSTTTDPLPVVTPSLSQPSPSPSLPTQQTLSPFGRSPSLGPLPSPPMSPQQDQQQQQYLASQNQSLTSEVQRLSQEGEGLGRRLRDLERNYESVVLELLRVQTGMERQDGLMQGLIAYFLKMEVKDPLSNETGNENGA